MKLWIDTREPSERIKLAQELYSDYETEVKELPVGDYILSDGQTVVAYEYKTIEDFLSSIKDGRVFNQARALHENFDYHFVIIVGNYTKSAEKLYHMGITTSRYQYNGAICRLNLISTCIFAPSTRQAFELMHQQATKCYENKVWYRKNPNIGKGVGNYLTCTVDGISDTLAERIESDLNLTNLTDLFNLTEDDLTSVPLIGKKKARNILRRIKSE